MEYRGVRYYRDRLSPERQRVYDTLVRQWLGMPPVLTLPAGVRQVAQVAQAVMYDHPMLFYVNFYRLEYLWSPGATLLKGSYFYSRQEARRLFGLCERWGREAVRRLPGGLTQGERAYRLAGSLAAGVRYCSADMDAHGLVGVVCKGRAVCEGISKVFKLLCDLADVPCIVVTGTVDGQNHLWNKVWLEGRPAFVDVTAQLKVRPSRSGFLLTSQGLGRYSWDRQTVPDVPDKARAEVS